MKRKEILCSSILVTTHFFLKGFIFSKNWKNETSSIRNNVISDTRSLFQCFKFSPHRCQPLWSKLPEKECFFYLRFFSFDLRFILIYCCEQNFHARILQICENLFDKIWSIRNIPTIGNFDQSGWHLVAKIWSTETVIVYQK